VESTLNGLYLVNGRQHVDNHTWIEHAAPHCTSRELYKGVLDGESTGVFRGRIFVHRAAQKTDAIQSNPNLLLSDKADINTKPQLEIYADDVRCTHGATIGQLDPEAVFYLRARGIGLEESRGVLVRAFAEEVLDLIRVEEVREEMKGLVGHKLDAGRKARSAR
jgi:Fe-S cluster assembly protein SufD